jgi:hypothetical protein
MFLHYLKPIYQPFKALRNKFVKVKTVKGNVKMDAKRVQMYKNIGQKKAAAVKGKAGAAQKGAQQAQGQIPQTPQQLQGQMPGAQGQQMQGQMPQGQGMPGGAPGINPNPPLKKVGFFKKRLICTQCNSQLDLTWDACPYCAQAAQQGAPAPSMKTQAFMIDAAGTGAPMQLLGWIVPLKGPQRGELFTLAPVTTVGTDPTSTIVLIDSYMSSHHAEIKAEGGTWVLYDKGSTNGTFVNDNRIEKQELIDNDVVKFGQSLVKFKSL